MATYRKFDWNRARRDFFTLFTDFFEHTTTDWILTTVEAGGSSATEALADAAGGILVVTNDAGDNDYDAFQWAGNKGAVAETFKFVAGKRSLKFRFPEAAIRHRVLATHTSPSRQSGYRAASD